MDPPLRPNTSYRRDVNDIKSENEWSQKSDLSQSSGSISLSSSALTPGDLRSNRPSPNSKIHGNTIGPHAIVGQVSYAPATQTTVVTTTTTTTTAFPPFVLKAPRHLHDLDPKLYPLAASPTPQYIRRFCFDSSGIPSLFQEAEDSPAALEEFQNEKKATANGPNVRVVTEREQAFTTPKSTSQSAFSNSRKIPSSKTSLNPRKRPASPVSISEAANIARLQRVFSNKRRNVSTHSYPIEHSHQSSVGGYGPKSAARPRTPATQNTLEQLHLHGRHNDERRVLLRRGTHQLARAEHLPESPHSDNQDNVGISSLENTSPNISLPSEMEEDSDPQLIQPRFMADNISTSTASTLGDAIAATPPITETDIQPIEPSTPIFETRDSRANSRADALQQLHFNSAVTQDLSLPSPSLSPVTAALNHGNHNTDLGVCDEDGDDTISNLDIGSSQEIHKNSQYQRESETKSQSFRNDRKLQITKPEEADFSNQQLPTPGSLDISSMVDSFDSLPVEMQTYLMYQFLRRSSKQTLQVVAAVVNPALKCDFLKLLPLELSLNVVSYLDAKSLCRAAQVSRKWRHIVNSNEQAWKDLFDRDGLVLPKGELARAILEGWGWQHPSDGEDYERDLSFKQSLQAANYASMDIDKALDLSSNLFTQNQLTLTGQTTPQSGRPKRKVAARYSARKQPKRKETPKPRLYREEMTESLNEAVVADGPYAAANAAAIAVPDAGLGLPNLRDLHLFKSIYRRHYLIRQNWMQDQIKPKHIAFRAHSRHVVTCLQFDEDKIITGSDDMKINVYDTKTGAQRCRLAGHEGGVWALQYYGNVLVSGSTDRTVRVWDIARGRCSQVFQGHTSTVRCLQILMPTQVGQAVDGKPIMAPKIPLIITGSRDSNLRVWKLPREGDPDYFPAGPPQNDSDCPFFVRTLAGHHHSVRAIAAHADTLVSGSYDSTVRVWKISTGETVHELQGHAEKVYSVVLDHKRNRCISGSMDKTVKVWNLDTGSVLFNLEGHTSLVGLLDLSHERLVSAAADSTLRIWDPENGQCKSILTAHTGAITCFQHDWQKVISGSDQTLKMWDIKTGKCVRNLLHDLSGVWQVKFDERRCVAAVQRDEKTYIEVLDFGASRDGFPLEYAGRRIVVDRRGKEYSDSVNSDTEGTPSMGEE